MEGVALIEDRRAADEDGTAMCRPWSQERNESDQTADHDQAAAQVRHHGCLLPLNCCGPLGRVAAAQYNESPKRLSRKLLLGAIWRSLLSRLGSDDACESVEGRTWESARLASGTG